jgi:carboxymethylenebutenolidase
MKLKSKADGFAFEAYQATPTDARRGGLVLIQEIFGVTQGMRELADGFAADGYEVLSPSMFDRSEPGFECKRDPEGYAKGVEYMKVATWEQALGDIQACIDALGGPVFVAGFCYGGTAAWLAACRCTSLSAASSFYGRRIPELLSETPRVPIILHFGRSDTSIPPATVEAIAAAHPDLPIHLYDAGHGFVSDRRVDHRPDAARLARLRTLQLFANNSGGRAEM